LNFQGFFLPCKGTFSFCEDICSGPEFSGTDPPQHVFPCELVVSATAWRWAEGMFKWKTEDKASGLCHWLGEGKPLCFSGEIVCPARKVQDDIQITYSTHYSSFSQVHCIFCLTPSNTKDLWRPTTSQQCVCAYVQRTGEILTQHRESWNTSADHALVRNCWNLSILWMDIQLRWNSPENEAWAWFPANFPTSWARWAARECAPHRVRINRIIESFRLEKTFKIIEPNCKPNTAKSTTKPRP